MLTLSGVERRTSSIDPPGFGRSRSDQKTAPAETASGSGPAGDTSNNRETKGAPRYCAVIVPLTMTRKRNPNAYHGLGGIAYSS